MNTRVFVIWFCVCLSTLTGCLAPGFGSQINCADIYNESEAAIPFDEIAYSMSTQWVTKTYGISEADIRIYSGTHMDWTKGPTSYFLDLASKELGKTWKQSPTVRNVTTCLGEPDAYRAYKLVDRYVLILSYTKKAIAFHLAYPTFTPKSHSPFDDNSQIWKADVFSKDSIEMRLGAKYSSLVRVWPGAIAQITVDYPDLR